MGMLVWPKFSPLDEYIGENAVDKVDYSVAGTYITLDDVRLPVDPRQFTCQKAEST